jgi:PKD repeat protein
MSKTILLLVTFVLLAFPSPPGSFVQAAADASVVISEVQIGGDDPDDDFVELFNPSDKAVDVSGWKLRKRTKSGAESSVRVFAGGSVVASRGYFLWANSKGAFKDQADQSGTAILAADNSLALFTKEDALADAVTWGDGHIGPFAPSASFPTNPPAGTSLERNLSDGTFSLQDSPSPRNSRFDSSPEPKPTPEPSPSSPLTVRLNEILPNPSDSEEEGEFIELFNFGNEDVRLDGWTLKDASANGKYVIPKNTVLKSGRYLALPRQMTGIALNNDTETLALLDPKSETVSSLAYQKAPEGQAYAFDGASWRWTDTPTPEKENSFPGPAAQKTYADSIRLNEILPNPKEKGEQTEFIELYNGSDTAIGLEGWMLRDASKTGRYVFPAGTRISAKGYLVLYRSVSKLSLSNTRDSVTLFDPNGNTADAVGYEKARENVSYNFFENAWQWSRFLTPGAPNQGNRSPSLKVKKPKTAYRGVPFELQAKAKDKDRDALKYVWDFGDGHRSYKAKTKHAYRKKGTYEVSLAVFDGSETAYKSFTVKVKDMPRPNVRIAQANPNPEGKDTDNEWILVENLSKGKVNLKDWSLATGWDKLANHPIREDFVLKPGEAKRLTRKLSGFTLNNKRMKLELRAPDKKKVHAVGYERAGSLKDDEILFFDHGKEAAVGSAVTGMPSPGPLLRALPDDPKKPADTDTPTRSEDEPDTHTSLKSGQTLHPDLGNAWQKFLRYDTPDIRPAPRFQYLSPRYVHPER